jgi:hypothetical protein
MSPLARLAIGILGASAVLRWAVKEVSRINAELDRVRTAATIDPSLRRTFPTLRRDPETGDWRLS